MSRAATTRFEIEQARRQQMYQTRVRETTSRFYLKYQQMYRQMVSDGLMDFVPSELARVQAYLSEMERNLEANPEAAREASFELGEFINSVRPLAKATEQEMLSNYREQMRQIKEERKQQEDKIVSYLFAKITAVKDPVVQDFAYADIQQLKAEIQANPATEEQIDVQLSLILERANHKAAEWKEKKKQAASNEIQLAKIDTNIEIIAADKKENEQEINVIIESLTATKTKLQKGTELRQEEVDSQIEVAMKETESKIMDERIRKETVKHIVRTLQDQGFIIQGKVTKITENDENFVRILAKKPSGKQAYCKVKLTGDFIYKFDEYEGQACQEDINLFKEKLTDIYGVQLSDERIIWENPDRISKNSKQLDYPTGAERRNQ